MYDCWRTTVNRGYFKGKSTSEGGGDAGVDFQEFLLCFPLFAGGTEYIVTNWKYKFNLRGLRSC